MADKDSDDLPNEILTLDSLTEYLKIPKSTLYKLLQTGVLPGRKVGRQWRFHKRAVDTWLTSKNAPEIEAKQTVKPRAVREQKRE